MKNINFFIIYAIVKNFKQITGIVKTNNNIFIGVFFHGAFILRSVERIADSFFSNAVSKSGMVKFYTVTHSLIIVYYKTCNKD